MYDKKRAFGNREFFYLKKMDLRQIDIFNKNTDIRHDSIISGWTMWNLRKNVGKRLFFHNKKLKKESNYRLHNFRIFFYIFRIYAFLVLMFTYLKMFLHLLLVPKCLFLSQYEQRDANASSNSSHLMASPSSGCAAAHEGGVPAPPAVQRSSQRSSAGSASGKAASTHPTPRRRQGWKKPGFF